MTKPKYQPEQVVLAKAYDIKENDGSYRRIQGQVMIKVSSAYFNENPINAWIYNSSDNLFQVIESDIIN